MKVLNYTTSYFAIILLIIISVWAGIFYYAMLDEIYDSLDDGLDNQKGLIIQKAAVDSSILSRADFEETGYAIKEIGEQAATRYRDVYIDTMMYMENEQDFEPVRLLKTVFHQHGKYYQLQIITSMVEEDDLVSELFYALLWLYIGLIASILILNNFLLKRIWKPFYHLLKQLKNFKLEQPSIEVKKTNIDEFKMLNETIKKLLQSNVDSYNSQKHFIENAAHELQTPLSISINKLEALSQSKNFSEEEIKLLASALNNLERLTRLNKALLLLSKIENKQFKEEEDINISTVVKNIAADFSDQLSFSNIDISINAEESLLVKMHPDLAVILVTNLIKNAIVHNNRDGIIIISTAKGVLVIKNSGKDAALDAQKLFTRFYKEKQSQSSSGLGLAIVKAIADLYGSKVSYTYNKYHTITVHFNQ